MRTGLDRIQSVELLIRGAATVIHTIEGNTREWITIDRQVEKEAELTLPRSPQLMHKVRFLTLSVVIPLSPPTRRETSTV